MQNEQYASRYELFLLFELSLSLPPMHSLGAGFDEKKVTKEKSRLYKNWLKFEAMAENKQATTFHLFPAFVRLTD